ncbi:GNAT family N-acetyltransferase [Pseudonocardia phyllosphaerae]|uniref:GNAT family N-acetyltransferase n=1 Tax=Pseudonocardia phyllosphaerae TaxID=3390502 RepID=UPI00397A6E99
MTAHAPDPALHPPDPALHRSSAADLDAATLHALLRLRVDVFVVEQECPYPEIDGRDLEPGTRHYWLTGDDGTVLATLRLLVEPGGGFRIGRVCTRLDARGRGLGHRLMTAVLDDVGGAPCVLDAQVVQEAFYARHGFVVTGEQFVEDGIPHVPMAWRPQPDPA